MKLNINAEQWNALDEGDRKKIQSIISGCFKGATITPDSNTPKIVEAESSILTNPICEATCNIAEEAATVACWSLSIPAVALCLLAAHVAGEECMKQC